ncbi:exported hypothetical protein [Agrobacterium deltaense NCPPB 1641]|uniref:Secreted protein n=1 Tax=Agrobacterium deltaense NCPPB 1641 TaxID=1183425 RepID=A0A1S7TUR6_9HYPH|nr:exported hypothetical protein [Agrobacterium deltaense NCPPB 1641]
MALPPAAITSRPAWAASGLAAATMKLFDWTRLAVASPVAFSGATVSDACWAEAIAMENIKARTTPLRNLIFISLILQSGTAR